MKTKLLTAVIVCALLISLTGCAADKTAPTLQHNVNDTVNTEVPAEPVGEMQAVTLTAETAENEMPAQPASTEAPQTSEAPETEPPRESEAPRQAEAPKQTESAEPPKQDAPSQPTEPEKPVETQPEPTKPAEPPKETEQPKPTEPPAPPAPTEPAPTEPPAPTETPTPTEPPAPVETEPPVETQPKTAYDYEFDINAIRADCIAIGQSMGYTLNTSLNPQNATWWNPVTASESNQGSTLRSALEQYIRFHTVANLSAYGMDEITEFNICCESRGGGSYAIYFVFA